MENDYKSQQLFDNQQTNRDHLNSTKHMIANKVKISELNLDKIKDISNFGGGGPMSSHHKTSSSYFDDSVK